MLESLQPLVGRSEGKHRVLPKSITYAQYVRGVLDRQFTHAPNALGVLQRQFTNAPNALRVYMKALQLSYIETSDLIVRVSALRFGGEYGSLV